MNTSHFIDIDGTLTVDGENANAEILADRLAMIRTRAISGQEFIIWSARGRRYAEAFCIKHKLLFSNVVACGKPGLVVDDKADIRPPGKMVVISPEEYFNNAATY